MNSYKSLIDKTTKKEINRKYTLIGDKMKKKLKKVLFPIFLSVVCGAICGRLVYGIYDKKLETDIHGEKIYLIQAGAYSTYDNMVENTSINHYVYYEDEDGLFKSIIGLTENYDNIEKIKNTYSGNVLISEYYSKDKELNNKIKEYDEKIKKCESKEEIQKLVLEMLSLYKDNKSTLTKITS